MPTFRRRTKLIQPRLQIRLIAAFLGEIIRGEKPDDCRLRKGDELQDLCRLLNRATAELRAREGLAAGESPHARGVERAA